MQTHCLCLILTLPAEGIHTLLSSILPCICVLYDSSVLVLQLHVLFISHTHTKWTIYYYWCVANWSTSIVVCHLSSLHFTTYSATDILQNTITTLKSPRPLIFIASYPGRSQLSMLHAEKREDLGDKIT